MLANIMQLFQTILGVSHTNICARILYQAVTLPGRSAAAVARLPIDNDAIPHPPPGGGGGALSRTLLALVSSIVLRSHRRCHRCWWLSSCLIAHLRCDFCCWSLRSGAWNLDFDVLWHD